jgi:hypothetical protein
MYVFGCTPGGKVLGTGGIAGDRCIHFGHKAPETMRSLED